MPGGFGAVAQPDPGHFAGEVRVQFERRDVGLFCEEGGFVVV